MPYYKSKNTTISERLTGISTEDGFEAARRLIQSERLGKNQKEAELWRRKDWIRHNGLAVATGIVGVFGSIETFFEFFFK